MTETKPRVLLEEMSWTETKEFLPNVKVAIVPVGATEQHGPHLPHMVDAALVSRVAKQTAEKLYPKAIVTPTLQVGISYHHLLFSGSLTISEDTMIRWCHDIAESLKHHGIDFVFFLSGHWGNAAALKIATREIREKLNIKTITLGYWEVYPDEHRDIVEDGEIPDHGCEFETSLMMAVREELVKKNWRRPPDAYGLEKKMAYLFAAADEQNPIFGHSKDGLIFGNPEKATREKGEKMFDVISDEVAKFVNKLLAAYVSESYLEK